MFPSFYTLPPFGGDDDLDDGEIASFINSEIHYHFYLNHNPRKMRSKKDLGRRSTSSWL
ncbi:unnamed protein product [Camellia sinensis]